VLTVREVLGDLDVRVLAGEASLDVPVRWVHISELRDPTQWLSGGELLLTTGMALDSAKRQREFIACLADHGLAGVGLGVGFRHDTVPPAMVQAAAERDFPLFEVPYELPFIALTEQAFTRLVNEQYALLQRSIGAQERLQRIVLSERGLEAIAAALAGLVGGTALVFDGRGELQAQRTFRREVDEQVVAAVGLELRERARRGDGRGFVPGHPDLAGRGLALPVGRGEPADRAGVPPAWLVAVKDSGGLAEIDRLILHQAVTVVALELLRRRVADSTERRLAGDVLSAAIAGELEGPELGRRLEPFGLGARVSALVVAPGERAVAQAWEAALTDALRAEAVRGLVAADGALVCALLPELGDDELFELGDRLVALTGETMGERPAAGAGRAVPVGRAREAYHEARCALEARQLGANGSGTPGDGNGAESRAGVATYRDLGSFQLLLSLQDSDALRLFCESLLGPIEHGEGHYGGELMRSLEAFIECNGQWEAAARRLFCHRHTLRYRIRKVEELTGRDLGSARDRIEFWLALRGREIVHTPHHH
jgi:PucR family transcriptional regulator, purine catabolism regulatory protein